MSSINSLCRWMHDDEVTQELHLTDEVEKSQLIKTSESLVATWRIFVEAQLQALQKDVKEQILSGIIFAGTWIVVLFLHSTSE
ncbi:unnamed protein product [Rotaria magnacalcarata]|uniref:DUF7865 domain-containing protein n=1 Tax=Rotaria magnacalcarata TaxID=392030 RepID=A0A816FVY0_9BILA|nr:unnamed protein product [Rotaria magnacalcarata]CAF3873157.1 unnamed protein product [Rotaria magnacalcarata]